MRALATASVATAPGSNLEAISATGQVSGAVSSGSATVSRFLIAPNGKLYVLFSQRVDLADTSQTYTPSGCLLAEVNPSTGIPTCIDSSLSMINWPNQGQGARNPPIQFDSSGAIYYSGYANGGSTVLRKYLNGATTDLITDVLIWVQILWRDSCCFGDYTVGVA
jgi:hypothetical protein